MTVRGIYNEFCEEWLVLNHGQNQDYWMLILDRVQFSPNRNEMHHGFHDTTAQALDLGGGFGQNVMCTGLRLMHPVFARSAGVSNRKTGATLMEAALHYVHTAQDDPIAVHLRTTGSIHASARCLQLLGRLSFYIELAPSDDDWETVWQSVRAYRNRGRGAIANV